MKDHNIHFLAMHLDEGHPSIYGNQAANSFPVIWMFTWEDELKSELLAAVCNDLNAGTIFLQNLGWDVTSLIPLLPGVKGCIFV